jgi:hypothetical protein
MIRRHRALTLAALALTLTFGVAACASPDATPEASAPAPSAEPTEPTEPQPEPTETTAEVPDPTCETMIPATTVADFESVGWTARADRMFAGEIEVVGGLQCVWADFEGPAGEHLQLFGWGTITAEDAQAAQDSLESQGWIREEAADGVYITERPETALAVDADGYGMTYFFGDGFVMLADTKQGLLLIEWPPA